MSLITLDEKARILNSLDDNLKEQLRSGKISWEEAASYVVPIGDLELERARELPQGLGVTQPAPQPGLDAVEVAGQPTARNSFADADVRNALNLQQFGTTAQIALDNDRRMRAERALDVQENGGTFSNPVYDPATGQWTGDTLGTQALDYLASKVNSKEDLEQIRNTRAASTAAGLDRSDQLKAALESLPANKASQEAVDAFNSGSYGTGIAKSIQASPYILKEQQNTLLAQAALTLGGTALTRGRGAGAIAAAAGGLGSATEFGAEARFQIDQLSPADRENPAVLAEALKRATKATQARMVVEAVTAPLAFGKTVPTKIATSLISQGLGEAGGEALASDIAGREVSGGELALEALAGAPVSVVTETGGVIVDSYKQNKLRGNLTQTLQQQADEATASLVRDFARRESEQQLGEANREAFDAEVEADLAIEGLRKRRADAEALNNATQTEMPFGSDMAGDATENDRTPTIVDMFSGESKSATKVQEELTKTPEETDEAFEIRKQRETAARDKIDNRKQDDFEIEQQRKADRRALEAEDQTILKNERRLQSTADITREAQRRLEIEKEEIRRKPENRRGIRNAKLGDTLAAYERKRRPELVDEVRKERVARINLARTRDIQRENARLRLGDIDVQADLDARSIERLNKETEANRPLSDDLFSTPEVKGQQELLPGELGNQPARPTYTGTLTEKQAEQEAAALLLARQRAREDTRPKASKKQTAEEIAAAEELATAIDSEMPSIEKALATEKQKAANLTVKRYAAKEATAQTAIIKDEISKEGATEESVKVNAATRMAEWRKANPAPAAAPTPTTKTEDGRDLVELAKKAKADKDKAAKGKETRNLTNALKRELADGKTPEEAAAAVRDRELSKEEDADLREELSTSKSSPVDGAAIGKKTSEQYADAVKNTDATGAKWAESRDLRLTLDKILAGNSPTKVGDLLRAVIAHKDTTAGEKWLANRLVALADNINIKLVPVELNPEYATYGGAYVPTSNSLWIRRATADTIIHEVLHGVTSNLLDSTMAKNNPKLKSAIAQLEYVLVVANQHWANTKDKGLVSDALAKMLDNTKGGPLSSATELVSYSLTDGALMQWLMQIELPGKKKTAWQGFKDAMKTIFTPRTDEQNTAMDYILEATSTMTETQEATPALSALFTAARRQKSGRGFTGAEPQSISGLLGNEESRKNTLNKTLQQLSSMYKNLAKAISATSRDMELGDSLSEFTDSAFGTPIEEMANRTIEKADLATYRQKLGQLPRNLARWAGLTNKIVTEDGGLMPLFHGTRIQTGANGKSFSRFEMPSDSGQLGIHASVAPQVATTFNKKAGEMGLMSEMDDALYVVAGRMSNPLRLQDFGLWDARAVLGAIGDGRNPQEMALAKQLKSLSFNNTRLISDIETREAILAAGFDGVVYLNRMEMGLAGMVTEKVARPRLDKLGIPLLPLDDEQRNFYNTTQSQNSARVTITLNSLSDEDFKGVFPEAAECYIFLSRNDVKSVTDNSGEFSDSPDIYASDDGSVAVEDVFSNPTAKREFWGPRGMLRPELKLKGKWVEAIADAVSAGGGSLDYMKGMRSAITEVFERSGSESGSLIAEAEGMFKKMEIALRKQANKAGKDPEVLRAEFSRDVEKLEAMAPGLTKTQAAKDLTTKYGNAAEGYFAARNKIDTLSNEILQQRLADPKPFTEEEAGVYRSIKENVGRYYSRVYAASTKGIGSRRAKRLLNEYEQFIKDADVDSKDGYEIIRNAIKYVSDNHLVVPDDDGLAEMTLLELSDMAKAWGIKVVGEADMNNPLTAEINRDSITSQLAKFRNATPKARESQARVLVEQLLFSKEHAALNKFYRGQAQNRTIVEERKIVPPEIRKLLGEYEDIPLKAMTTLIRMATFRANTKLFNELIERSGGTLILTPEQASEKGISPEEWEQMPESAAYGPLAGMWVRKDLAPRIKSTTEITSTFDQLIAQGEEGVKGLAISAGVGLMEGWMGFAGTVKMMQLVFNAANAAWNYGGGGLAMLSNGNLNPKTVVRAHKIATSLIASQASSHMTPDMIKIIRAGITDSAMMGAIRKVEAEKLEDVLFAHLETKREKLVSKGKRKVSAGNRIWRETYAMADVVWKIANFLEEERKLTALYKAEGVEMPEEAIEREAAARTNQTNFSYKRVPNWIKAIEKGGVTYIFPYIYETFRAPATSLMLGIADLNRSSKMKTPEGKRIMMASGIQRVGGSLLAMGAMQMAMHAGAQALAEAFGGMDDEETEKLKALMPDFKKFADLLYLGRTAEGKPVILEFSRLDPFGPSTEFFRMVMAGAEAEDYQKAIGSLIIGNPYGRGIFQSLVGQGGTNTRMQEMTPDIYARLVQGFETIGLSGTRQAKAIDLLLPSGLVRPFDPNNAPVEGDFATWIFTAAGGQLHNIDANKSIEFAAVGYNSTADEIRTSFYNTLKIQETSDESLLSKMSDLREEEKENFLKLKGLYDGMLKLGYTREEVLGQMASRNVPKNALAMLSMGGYVPEGSGIVSVRGLKQSWENVSGSTIGDDRKRRYYDNIMRTLQLVESGQVPAKE